MEWCTSIVVQFAPKLVAAAKDYYVAKNYKNICKKGCICPNECKNIAGINIRKYKNNIRKIYEYLQKRLLLS